MQVNNVPKSDVGMVVQDFIDNDESVVVARKVAENNYTVGPGAELDGGRRRASGPGAIRTKPSSSRKRKSGRRKPS